MIKYRHGTGFLGTSCDGLRFGDGVETESEVMSLITIVLWVNRIRTYTLTIIISY